MAECAENDRIIGRADRDHARCPRAVRTRGGTPDSARTRHQLVFRALLHDEAAGMGMDSRSPSPSSRRTASHLGPTLGPSGPPFTSPYLLRREAGVIEARRPSSSSTMISPSAEGSRDCSAPRATGLRHTRRRASFLDSGNYGSCFLPRARRRMPGQMELDLHEVLTAAATTRPSSSSRPLTLRCPCER